MSERKEPVPQCGHEGCERPGTHDGFCGYHKKDKKKPKPAKKPAPPKPEPPKGPPPASLPLAEKIACLMSGEITIRYRDWTPERVRALMELVEG